MEHILKLQPKYFDYINNGTKRIELRLYDDKRKKISIGDTIIFQKEPELIDEIYTEIIGLKIKKSFKELINTLDISQYSDKNETKEKFLKDLYKFYTKEKEEKYGVVGIEIKLKKENLWKKKYY